MKRFFLFVSVVLLIVGFFGKSYAISFDNGGFEDAGVLSGWETNGIVSQVPSGGQVLPPVLYTITANEGSQMALLSAPGYSNGGSYTDNWISQDLAGFQGGAISFYYNLFTTEPGVDPAVSYDKFIATFSDKDHNNEIYSWEIDEWSAVNYTDNFEFYYSDWQLFSHDFGPFTQPFTLSIKLSSGNGGGNDDFNTWTYLDSFSLTQTVPVPEPGTILLLSSGLLSLIAYKKKRDWIV